MVIDKSSPSSYYLAMKKWLPFIIQGAANIIEKLPIERLLVKPRDTAADREELKEILSGVAQSPQAEKPPITPGLLQPRIAKPQHPRLESPEPAAVSAVSTQETIDYQKREIGKELLVMERHLVQKFRIAGKVCDCGQSRHLLLLEKMCEETLSMDTSPDTYNQILEWVSDLGPKCTIEAVGSGLYDNEYKEFALKARDLRKELLGTLDPHALWPGSEVKLEDILKKHEEAEAPR